MYVDSPHLQDWLSSGKARLVPIEFASRFGKFLDSMNWRGTRLDWSGLQFSQANLKNMSEAELICWARSTSLGNDPYLVFWFCADEPCIACDLDFGILNLDYVYWKAPGPRYMFGAVFYQGNWIPHFGHLIEYDGAEKVIGRLG